MPGTATIQRTDVSMSPLLSPVIQRSYTSGINTNVSPGSGNAQTSQPDPDQKKGEPLGPDKQEHGPNYNATPVDETKSFSFDEETGNASDLAEGEQGPGVTLPTGSARTFANTIGNLVQIYLPRATYGYVKIDMNSVIANVEKGNLTTNWVEAFEKMNKSAETALAIPDENIKMWKAALQHYLEYKQMAFANPETEFWVATGVLVTDQGIRTYSLKKQLEQYMKEALSKSNPEIFTKKQKEAEVNNNNKDNDGTKA